MAEFIKGDIVVIPFPFSDLSEVKKRSNRIFTADKNIILYKVGSLKESKTKEVIEKIVEIITE